VRASAMHGTAFSCNYIRDYRAHSQCRSRLSTRPAVVDAQSRRLLIFKAAELVSACAVVQFACPMSALGHKRT